MVDVVFVGLSVVLYRQFIDSILLLILAVCAGSYVLLSFVLMTRDAKVRRATAHMRAVVQVEHELIRIRQTNPQQLQMRAEVQSYMNGRKPLAKPLPERAYQNNVRRMQSMNQEEQHQRPGMVAPFYGLAGPPPQQQQQMQMQMQQQMQRQQRPPPTSSVSLGPFNGEDGNDRQSPDERMRRIMQTSTHTGQLAGATNAIGRLGPTSGNVEYLSVGEADEEQWQQQQQVSVETTGFTGEASPTSNADERMRRIAQGQSNGGGGGGDSSSALRNASVGEPKRFSSGSGSLHGDEPDYDNHHHAN
jgi:hypothetical protein